MFHNKFVTDKLSSLFSEQTSEAKLIDGKKIAEEIRGELREQICEWMKKENQRAPQLTAVLVGDDPASSTYVNNKMKVIELILLSVEFKLIKYYF